MPIATLQDITVNWTTNPIAATVKATGLVGAKKVTPSFTAGIPPDGLLLAKLLERWSKELKQGKPITADVSASGKKFV